MPNELTTKHNRIKQFMTANDLDAVVLTTRANFAWLTGGNYNYVVLASQQGIASLIVENDRITCVTNNIEAGRLRHEELTGLNIDVAEHKWHDTNAKIELFSKLLNGKRAAADLLFPELPQHVKPLDPEFNKLRWQLTDEEVQRYKQAGQLASQAIEQTCNQLQPGMTEMQIAALAAKNVIDRSCRPWVILIAADDRILRYRHPIPTEKKLEKIVMVVLGVEKFGLICSLTRLVSFAALDEDLRARHAAVTAVDAAMNLSTTPGSTLASVFDTARKAYAEHGFADQWELHHQGGPTGYAPRDVIATPGDQQTVLENQAFAWNPSITGTKSEDTIIVTRGEPIIVTAAGKDWPMVQAAYNGKTLPRPDILVR